MTDKTKILILDIETTPLTAYSWGPKWDTNLIEIREATKILSFSAKWLGGKQITMGWQDYGKVKNTADADKLLVNDLWHLLNAADIVVTQNGKQFDVKVMNSRFAFYGMTPPAPYKVVDTKTEAKKYLRLPSYSLDDMCDYFGIGRKLNHEGFSLWKRCMDGDKKAWKVMLAYNKQDVLLTEQLYLALRPWMATHPSVGMFSEKVVCPKCGADKLQARGFAVTKTLKYRRYQCQACGGWGRHTTAEDEQLTIISI